MPLARSFRSILNSFGKVKRATKRVRKDMNISWKKRRPARHTGSKQAAITQSSIPDHEHQQAGTEVSRQALKPYQS